jgi:superfamily II DNA or RNA helicase
VRKDLADALVQSGVPTTVVTNAPPEGIREQLSEYPFDVYSQQGEPRKEDPEFFRELLKEKQVSPEEVFYFDHNPANLAAARKAGIRGVPYASDISNRRDLIVLLSSLSKEKPAKKKPADVYIIRGNPGVDTEHAAEYDAFYDAIKKNVEARGLTAEFDPGLAYTSPPGGKYWIAHSRGKSRLRGAPKNVQTLALDDYEPAEARQRQAEHNQKMFKALGVTNVAGIPRDQRLQPGPEHYTFNDDMRAALDNMFLSKQDKVAYAAGSSASEKATVLKRIMKKHSRPGTKASDRGGLKPDVKLQPHQQRIVDAAGPGIRKLLYHGLGSGKTLSAIAAAEKAQQPYGAVVPAALRPNFAKEQDKFTDRQLASDIQSYTMLARGKKPEHTGTVIMDEAHRLRNPDTEQTRVAKQLAEATDQLYLLSGSPIVNAPADLAPLMEMLTQETMTPEAFNEKYLRSKHVTPSWIDRWKGVTPGVVQSIKNKKKLHEALRGKVDYYEPAESPVAREEERIVVDMSPEQEQLHNEFYGTLPRSLRRKLDMKFPLSKSEQRSFLAFLSGPRQVALSTAPWQSTEERIKTGLSQSPKLQRALFELEAQIEKDPESRTVVFSNFITAGLEPYAAALAANKIPHGIFHGGLNDKQRAELVNKYNAGDLRVLLMGPSGGEGISLEGTKLIQLLDPHWNEARLNQAVGRGIRYDSHEHLPEKDRKVKIQRFISQLPDKKQKGLRDLLSVLMGRGKPVRDAADAHLENYARDKQRLNDLFLAELKNIGTEKGSVSKQAAEEQWIGVDLDGTLAKYRGWKGATHIGTPIPSMVSRVKRWVREGKVVKIFTARVAGDKGTARRAIEKWCKTHIGKVLPITCVKDKNCVRIWDDRAVGVKSNKGRQVKLEYADKLTAAVKLAKARSNKSKDKEASANVLGLAVNICLVNHSSVS